MNALFFSVFSFLSSDRCKYDYEGQSEYELSYSVGDTVNVISKEEDPWWEATIKGKKGMVYKEFLEPA